MKSDHGQIVLIVLFVAICLTGCAHLATKDSQQIKNSEAIQGLPQIKDPNALRQDCVLLFQQFPPEVVPTNSPVFTMLARGQLVAREIPESVWPASIQLLHPFKVTRDEYAVCIWILHNPDLGGRVINLGEEPEKNWDAKGYYVQINPRQSPPRSTIHGMAAYNLKATGYEGIDEFTRPMMVF